MKEEQDEHSSGIGYRPMTEIVSRKLGKRISSKRIRSIMKERDLQSEARRRKFSDETYAKRRKLKESVPPDLVKRRFFALEPMKKLAEDITYLTGCDGTLYLNTRGYVQRRDSRICHILITGFSALHPDSQTAP